MFIRQSTLEDLPRLLEIYKLRIDTHPDNQVMKRLLIKLGFTRCGIIHVAQDNIPRIAFEK